VAVLDEQEREDDPDHGEPPPTMNAREKPSVSAPGSAECAPWAARSRVLVREVATVAQEI
jgi:hypothetical protein